MVLRPEPDTETMPSMAADVSSPERKTPARKPSARGVTMETVGKIAGVSQVTVSRALREPSKVSPITLAKIKEAIEVTGFVPNAIAGALASNKSKLISALVPSITNVTYSSMLQSFSKSIRDEGYQIMLSETGLNPEDEEQMIARHLSRRPDAILLTGIHHTAQARRMLLASDTPVVELWDITDTPIDMCFGFSHPETGRSVAEFAHDAGYTCAGAIAAGDERARRRMRAFSERFQGLSGRAVAEVGFDAEASLRLGREGLAKLLDEHGLSKAVVFCSSDIIAHGVIIEAQVQGLNVPEDVAVVGFGDQNFAQQTDPSLTTVRVDREALGICAASALLDRFAGSDEIQIASDIGFEIVRRASA